MAAKSVTQRVMELVAVVAVLTFGAMIVRSILPERPQAEALPDPSPGSPTVALSNPISAPQPPTDPGASRAPVDSVVKLPERYPRIEELKTLPSIVLTPEGLSATSSLEPADKSVLGATQVRHLNTYQEGLLAFDPGGKHAVVMELTPASTTRLAVWDLSTGKLVRFLSMEQGRQPRLYGGKENDDFGAVVDTKERFFAFAVSPRGERLAARLSDSRGDAAYYFWDLPTAMLLSAYRELEDTRGQLVFAGEEYAITEFVLPNSMVTPVRIHVETGDADLFAGLGIGSQAAMVASAGFAGGAARFDQQNIHLFRVSERRYRRIPAAGMREGIERAFFATPDGTHLIGISLQLDVEHWDLASGKKTRSTSLTPAPPLSERASMLTAVEAGLLAFKSGPRQVQFYDLETGKLVSTILTPFERGELVALSSAARRMVFSTDQSTLLVVDLPRKLPGGVINLVDLLPKEKLAATR